MFFKELFKLIALLFTSIKSEELETLQMKYFPFQGYPYMMWCGRLIYRNESAIRRITDEAKNHERIHLLQAKRKKAWIIYYLCYFWYYLTGVLRCMGDGAYNTIPYEMEAYANEDNPDYDGSRYKVYKIKHRRNTYIDEKWHWKEYIKTL